jgi:hypothetical protein
MPGPTVRALEKVDRGDHEARIAPQPLLEPGTMCFDTRDDLSRLAGGASRDRQHREADFERLGAVHAAGLLERRQEVGAAQTGLSEKITDGGTQGTTHRRRRRIAAGRAHCQRRPTAGAAAPKIVIIVLTIP